MKKIMKNVLFATLLLLNSSKASTISTLDPLDTTFGTSGFYPLQSSSFQIRTSVLDATHNYLYVAGYNDSGYPTVSRLNTNPSSTLISGINFESGGGVLGINGVYYTTPTSNALPTTFNISDNNTSISGAEVWTGTNQTINNNYNLLRIALGVDQNIDIIFTGTFELGIDTTGKLLSFLAQNSNSSISWIGANNNGTDQSIGNNLPYSALELDITNYTITPSYVAPVITQSSLASTGYDINATTGILEVTTGG